MKKMQQTNKKEEISVSSFSKKTILFYLSTIQFYLLPE